MVGASYV